jgi:TatD DNase family protein
MWFDSHCHLYDLGSDEPVEKVVARAAAAGVTGMLVLGTDPLSSRAAAGLTSIPGVWAGAAYHPSETKGWQDSWVDEIDAMLAHERVVAVGETGIDLHWDTSFRGDQEAAFKAHAGLAKKHNKALVIHTRNSMNETLAILEGDARSSQPRMVFHCWSGDATQLERALALGAYISFAGNVSFKKADGLRAAAAAVPEDWLLVETDSPYLTPEPHRGKRNEPAFVGLVGDAVARARDEPSENIARITAANARKLFGISV